MKTHATNSEMLALQVLSDRGQATAKEVHAALEGTTGWALSTVITFLRRLEAKGLVAHRRQKGKRAFLFRPTRKAQSARKRLLRDLLERAFGGNPLPLVSALLEEISLDESQLEELRELLDRHTAGGKRS